MAVFTLWPAVRLGLYVNSDNIQKISSIETFKSVKIKQKRIILCKNRKRANITRFKMATLRDMSFNCGSDVWVESDFACFYGSSSEISQLKTKNLRKKKIKNQ
jgi:hypothetical protein